MGCGCNGSSSKKVLGDRQFAPAGERVILPFVVQNPKPDHLMVVAVTVKHGELLYGKATGACYGKVGPGICFPMHRDDLEADKRLLKLTKDTMRLFA